MEYKDGGTSPVMWCLVLIFVAVVQRCPRYNAQHVRSRQSHPWQHPTVGSDRGGVRQGGKAKQNIIRHIGVAMG